ncbi:MAG TPA: hypothetical protein VGF67_08050 [Ktedonobacteraceae bacterium]|jgi:hypothetical protein
METQDEHPQWKVLLEFAQLLLDHQDDLEDYEEEFRRLAYRVACETFHPQTVNRRLAEYATRWREQEGISHAYSSPDAH